MMTTPAAIRVKNRTGTQVGDDLGFALGGGCLVTLFERLFGMGGRC